MTDILNFPTRSRRKDPQEFLQESSETLQFDTGSQVTGFTMPASSTTDPSPSKQHKAQYWSNQELAHLYRVKRLLDAAGIACEIDHGSTDEGDPWLVFCDGTGEVFIHLCRIDGCYLLDSPNVTHPLTGTDFNGLIDAFTQRHIPDGEQSTAQAGQRVVRFERNGTVFLHPATMLAALVWTLLMDSEDLVMILPADDDGQAADVDSLAREPLPVSADSGTSSADHVLLQTDLARPETPETMGDAQKLVDHQSLMQALRDQGTLNDSKLNYSTYAIGLSAIAISCGFISQKDLADFDPTPLSGIIADLVNAESRLESEGYDPTTLFLDNAEQNFLAFVSDVFEDIRILDDARNVADREKLQVAESSSSDDSQGFHDYLHALIEKTDGEKSLEAVRERDVASIPLGQENAFWESEPPSSVDAAQSNDGNNAAETFLATISKTDDVTLSLESLQTMTFHGTQIRATSDVTRDVWAKANSLVESTSNDLSLPLTDDENISFDPKTNGRQQYDEKAEEILQFIYDSAQEIEIVATKDEVMFFDAAIVDANTDDVMVLTWSLNNGDTIAAMGLRSQLQDFDYIA